jgi:hypothetical protein
MDRAWYLSEGRPFSRPRDDVWYRCDVTLVLKKEAGVRQGRPFNTLMERPWHPQQLFGQKVLVP